MAARVFSMAYMAFLIQTALSQGNIPSTDGGTGLSQIDLEADGQYVRFSLETHAKDVTVCTTQKKPLSCSYPGSNIAITGVFWGRLSAGICPSDDGDTELNCFTSPETEGIVKAKCEGKESCELEARHALLQGPKASHCPGVNKYLIVNYTCVPDAKEVVLCDTENSTLWCPATWKIGVNSVFWGRQSTVVCPAENGQTTCTGAPESLGIVKKSCDGLGRCEVHASANQVQNGAENCPGVAKYLIINYSCRPHPNIGTEDDTELIPEQQATPVKPEEPEELVKQETEEEQPEQQQAKTKESVAKALKQLDEGQKPEAQVQAEPDAAVSSDLNIGRLGMGGLKALEKINNLIKASAESQGGDESVMENGLTDDQAQTIERMIIEGIKNIKKKTPETGTRKASIPRKITTTNTQMLKPKPASEHAVKASRKSGVSKILGQPAKVGKVASKTAGVAAVKAVGRDSVSGARKATVLVAGTSGRDMKPVPVLRDTEKGSHNNRAKIRGLRIGNAGTGNQP